MSREVVQSLLNAAGYSKAGVAGVLGNAQQESSFDPTQVGAAGELGLFQHLGSRRKELEDFAKSLNRPATDPHVQTAFAIKEIKRDYPKLDELLRTTNDPARAAVAFGKIFERPNEAKANWEGRVAAAQQFAQNLQSGTMTDADVPGYSVTRNANTLENQPQKMENANEKDQKGRKDTPLLTLYDIYDKANADAISLMTESREFNQAVTDDVIENLRKVAEGGKDYRIQGYKASLKQSLDMLAEYENDNSVPRDAVMEMKHDLLDHIATHKDASFLDYIINQGRQLTGMSPRVAGNAVGQMAAQNAPTVGTDPFGQETGLPQSLENKQTIARNVSDLATSRFGAARERLPKGVDTAQGIAGALATAPIGISTKAPILTGALTSAVQSALSTENPTGGNVLTNAGIGLGAGSALGTVLKGGSGLVSGLRGRSTERQAGEMLTQGISEGIGNKAPQAGLAQLGKIEQRFAQRPDIPLAAQGAVDSTFSTVAPRASEYRAIQRITQRLAKTDGPAAEVIGKNLARVMDEGAPQRISNMLERTIGTNATAGEVENIVVPAMQQQGRNALQNLFRYVPNLDEKTTSNLMDRMMKSSAYEKAYNEIRTSGLMGDRVVAIADDSSTQLQQAIRARLIEWNNAKGGAFENKLNPEIKALGRYLRVGTRTEAGNPASSMWGAFNDTYANSQAIRRAVEKGQDIEKLAPEAVVTAMGKTSQEQQAFAIGAMQVVRSKLNAANYRVGDSFSNPELNAKVSQALGSPEKTDAFLRWLGEEMQISKTVSGIKGDLNATGEAVQEATGRLKSLLRDPWEVAAIVRGSFLYAASRAAGDVVRSLATGKGASTEAKRLMAAYTTTTDPEMQAKLVDLARAEYIRQYTKHQIAAAASTTGGRVIGEQIGDNEE